MCPNVWIYRVNNRKQMQLCLKAGRLYAFALSIQTDFSLVGSFETFVRTRRAFLSRLSALNKEHFLTSLASLVYAMKQDDIILLFDRKSAECAVGIIDSDYEFDRSSKTAFHSRKVLWAAEKVNISELSKEEGKTLSAASETGVIRRFPSETAVKLCELLKSAVSVNDPVSNRLCSLNFELNNENKEGAEELKEEKPDKDERKYLSERKETVSAADGNASLNSRHLPDAGCAGYDKTSGSEQITEIRTAEQGNFSAERERSHKNSFCLNADKLRICMCRRVLAGMIRLFRGRDFVRLVSAVFRAEGFNAGVDNSSDFVAVAGRENADPLRVFVRVKTALSPVSEDEYAVFCSDFKSSQASYAVFVSPAGFGKDIYSAAADDLFKIRLWSGEDLAAHMMEAYDHMEEPFRSSLPLRRVWCLS